MKKSIANYRRLQRHVAYLRTEVENLGAFLTRTSLEITISISLKGVDPLILQDEYQKIEQAYKRHQSISRRLTLLTATNIFL